MNKAKRYNKGKTRHELMPTHALSKIAEVYTRGAHKYTLYKDSNGNIISGKDIPFEDSSKYEIHEDGANNWMLGQSWTDASGSIKRHLAAHDLCEDIDPELKTMHLANAAWGIIQLIEYHKIYPQGDDRHHKYLSVKRIGLDIDEVICDFTQGWADKYGVTARPTSWLYDRKMSARFDEMKAKGELEDFYLSLKPKVDPDTIPFEPVCYVTSRPISSEVTERWIDMHGFPQAKVLTVGVGESKVDALKKAGVEIFVDDRFSNFAELNKAGICTYLYDAPHNQRYDVGMRRIKSLTELA